MLVATQAISHMFIIIRDTICESGCIQDWPGAEKLPYRPFIAVIFQVVFVKISQAYLDLELPECAFIYAKATTSFPAIRKGEQGTPRNAEIVLAKAADALGHPDGVLQPMMV